MIEKASSTVPRLCFVLDRIGISVSVAVLLKEIGSKATVLFRDETLKRVDATSKSHCDISKVTFFDTVSSTAFLFSNEVNILW